MLPVDGPITMQDIATELNLPTTQSMSLDDELVRHMAMIPEGQIGMKDCYGKADFPKLHFVEAPYSSKENSFVDEGGNWAFFCQAMAIFVYNDADTPMSMMSWFSEFWKGREPLPNASQDDLNQHFSGLPISLDVRPEIVENGAPAAYLPDPSMAPYFLEGVDKNNVLNAECEVWGSLISPSGAPGILPPRFGNSHESPSDVDDTAYTPTMIFFDNISTATLSSGNNDLITPAVNLNKLKALSEEVTGKTNVATIVLLGSNYAFGVSAMYNIFGAYYSALRMTPKFTFDEIEGVYTSIPIHTNNEEFFASPGTKSNTAEKATKDKERVDENSL